MVIVTMCQRPSVSCSREVSLGKFEPIKPSAGTAFVKMTRLNELLNANGAEWWQFWALLSLHARHPHSEQRVQLASSESVRRFPSQPAKGCRLSVFRDSVRTLRCSEEIVEERWHLSPGSSRLEDRCTHHWNP